MVSSVLEPLSDLWQYCYVGPMISSSRTKKWVVVNILYEYVLTKSRYYIYIEYVLTKSRSGFFNEVDIATCPAK